MNKKYQIKKISKERMSDFKQVCKNLDIRFNDYNILDLALHHRSYSNEDKAYSHYNNERLEFLGDSVLGLATAAFLYEDMFQKQEGDLAKIKSNVVSEKSLAPIAKNVMNIHSLLVLGKGEENTGGRLKPAILADAVEAVIGALYLDQGYEAAEKLVLKLIVPEIRNVQSNKGNKDWKTKLQEYYQKTAKKCPVYILESVSGPDHEQKFSVTVHLGSKVYGPAVSNSKKNAEQLAAQNACQQLGIN